MHPCRKGRLLFGLLAALGVLLTPARAQDVISHRPGLLSYSAGVVELFGARPGQDEPGRLVHVEEGQALVTEIGRAEMMLGPDRFLRLGEATRVELVSSEAGNVEIRLHAGSAILDLPRALRSDRITLWCDDARVEIVKRGLYRLDRPPSQRATLKVFRGKAIVSAHGAPSVGPRGQPARAPSDALPETPCGANGPKDCSAPPLRAAAVTVKTEQSIRLPLARHRGGSQASFESPTQSPAENPTLEQPCSAKVDCLAPPFLVTKFDRSEQDAFGEWSRKRTAGLLAATRRAERAQTQPITDLRAVPGVVIGGGPATSTPTETGTRPPAQTGGQQGKTK